MTSHASDRSFRTVNHAGTKPIHPLVHALARFAGEAEKFELGVDLSSIIHCFIQRKIKIRKKINFVEDTDR